MSQLRLLKKSLMEHPTDWFRWVVLADYVEELGHGRGAEKLRAAAKVVRECLWNPPVNLKVKGLKIPGMLLVRGGANEARHRQDLEKLRRRRLRMLGT